MKGKVLIVEDQFIEANNLRKVLELAGYEVCSVARSVDEALRILRSDPPDLVLLDIFLKGEKTGIDLAPVLKERNIPFIYLSANSDEQTFKLAKQTSPYGFLVKPFREKDVLAMLDIAADLHNEHRSLARAAAKPKAPADLKNGGTDNFGMAGKSSGLKDVARLIQIAAAAESPVLILGESGTGKELVARAIHDHSARGKKPLIIVDCAAISPTLIESELFGHEKGSFTGAADKRIGKFEQAENGTIFLDEIGEMPLEIQSKLLRVLQEKEICPIGGKLKKVNVRIIAATNRNLEEEIAAGRFRLDLYYRLYVFPVELSPLRERKADIMPIAEHYLGVFAAANNKHISGFSEPVRQALLDYPWPGNVRQLINLVERSVLLCEGRLIDRVVLPVFRQTVAGSAEPKGMKSMTDNERDHILDALAKCNWKIYGPGGAADLLHINSSTLKSRMVKLGISKQFG
ncbi:sigma-54 dependent transcriptional regulator [Mucilaginibacter sp. BJC16-A38]|uniref:sigma-54-dependent transcriptional regulator n=1 Tax=Mucilaginibacter phenanthrenivorans TaxID=1234842 RepID=UPI0021581CFE|nr:sigma-54 dependent transcriptional regulator [Mucilaginibacter phenanthrenivorans]MCR8557301.1 sigma-54 dependent transcriptional regulator [Mucilaginibacter phenanthrenivorans]